MNNAVKVVKSLAVKQAAKKTVTLRVTHTEKYRTYNEGAQSIPY